MLRVKPLILLNSLAILVIAGAFIWVFRLPGPDAALQSAPNSSEGVSAIAAGVTVAVPARSEPNRAQGSEPTSVAALQPMSTDPTVPAPMPDAGWLARTTGLTGVPERALQAYVSAAATTNAAQPGCSIGWNTLAAIGLVESGHGSHGGASLAANGTANVAIVGPQLNGEGYARIPDTDGGTLDGDARWDRAVGPMQFIPSTWRTAGRDGNGDGVADPLNIDDAALSAAEYLCSGGRNLRTGLGWTDAVFSYNHSGEYVSRIREQANAYAAQADLGR